MASYFSVMRNHWWNIHFCLVMSSQIAWVGAIAPGHLETRVLLSSSIKMGCFPALFSLRTFPFPSSLHASQSPPFQSHIIKMRFSSALFVALSASLAVAVPVNSGTEAAAEWFDKAYSEKRSLEKDAAATEWFDKAYESK